MQHRRKLLLLVAALVLITGILSAEAGIGFAGGVNAGGGSIRVNGKLVGYGGDQDVSVRMQVDGSNINTFCQNHGGNIVPGQPVDIYIDETFALSPNANGNYPFDFHEEYLPTAEEADCPNGNWTVNGVEGNLLVTLGAYESGATEPAIELVFSCDVNMSTIVECDQIQ